MNVISQSEENVLKVSILVQMNLHVVCLSPQKSYFTGLEIHSFSYIVRIH